MNLEDVSWQGPDIDDAAILEGLPDYLITLLQQANGFIQFQGGFHCRGACVEPKWHSIRHAWRSSEAFHHHYKSILTSDVPFAEDALGDQYFLRDDLVIRLSAEVDEIEPLDMGLMSFLESIQADAKERLYLQPLENFRQLGGTLLPGQLLSVFPPFVLASEGNQRSYRAISAADRLCFLADLARQIRDLPDGAAVQLNPV